MCPNHLDFVQFLTGVPSLFQGSGNWVAAAVVHLFYILKQDWQDMHWTHTKSLYRCASERPIHQFILFSYEKLFSVLVHNF